MSLTKQEVLQAALDGKPLECRIYINGGWSEWFPASENYNFGSAYEWRLLEMPMNLYLVKFGTTKSNNVFIVANPDDFDIGELIVKSLGISDKTPWHCTQSLLGNAKPGTVAGIINVR